MGRVNKKQVEMGNLPPVDPVYEKGEEVLTIRRNIEDLKSKYQVECLKLIELMRSGKKTTIRIDGANIKIREIQAKINLIFKEDE